MRKNVGKKHLEDFIMRFQLLTDDSAVICQALRIFNFKEVQMIGMRKKNISIRQICDKYKENFMKKMQNSKPSKLLVYA